MVRAGVEKVKLKLILKSYILCQGEATCKELTKFINTNFKFLTTVDSYKISGLLKDNQQGILAGLKREKKYLKNEKCSRMVYYFE